MMRMRESDCANCDHPQHDGVCTQLVTNNPVASDCLLCGCDEYEERGVTDYVDDGC